MSALRDDASLAACACALVASIAGCAGVLEAPAAEGRSAGPAGIGVSSARMLRLTRVEYERSVRAALGDEIVDAVRLDYLPSDGSSGPFASNVSFDATDDHVEAYRAVAELIAAEAGTHADALLGCDPTSSACVDGFLARIGAALHRRPLRDAELAAYRALFDQARTAGTHADGVRLALTAFLQSTRFLYRIEVGSDTGEEGIRQLTGYELATRLALFLWKAPPDAALLEAAESGALDSVEGIEAEARRMLDDERADAGLVRFHLEWLGAAHLANQDPDEARFPAFRGLIDDMEDETAAFVRHVFREEDASIATLLTARYTFVSPELAAHYGITVEAPADGTPVRASLPATRAGILTQGAFVASHGHDPTTAAVQRGRAIRERILCQPLQPPPPVDTVIDADPALSARQQLDAKTSPEACVSCHRLMNPLGFPFDHFDLAGAYRTEDEGGYPIDATGELIASDVDGPLDGAVELASRLAESEEVERCVTRQWFRFALGRDDADADEPSIRAAYQRYAASGGDLRELIVALTTTDAFRHRARAE
jgi:hypothetical protein